MWELSIFISVYSSHVLCILANIPVRYNEIIIHYITGGTDMVVRQSRPRDTTATVRWLEPTATAPRAHCVTDHGKTA
jgi:hypothetical protein